MLIQASYKGQETSVEVPAEIVDVLASVGAPQRGTFAYIRNHVSGFDQMVEKRKDGTTKPGKCIKPHVSNILFVTSPRYDKYLERLLARVKPIGFARFSKYVEGKGLTAKLAVKLAESNVLAAKKGEAQHTIESLFDLCKAKAMDDCKAKIAGTFESASHDAHETCYCSIDGWKCHLVTKENEETGHKEPVIGDDGMMTVKSIMLPFFQVKRWTVTPGEWRPVNSAAKTIVQDTIQSMTKLGDWKTFSLQKGNFEAITLQGAEIVGAIRADCAGIMPTEVFDADVSAIGAIDPQTLCSMTSEAGLMPVVEESDIEISMRG